MRARLLRFLLVMFALAVPALAQDRRGGPSLDRVLPQIRHSVPGTFYDAEGPYLDSNGQATYRIKWMTPDGRMIWFFVDARSGQVLGGAPGGHYRDDRYRDDRYRDDHYRDDRYGDDYDRGGHGSWGSSGPPRNDWPRNDWRHDDGGRGFWGGRGGDDRGGRGGDDRGGRGGHGSDDRGGKSGGHGGWSGGGRGNDDHGGDGGHHRR